MIQKLYFETLNSTSTYARENISLLNFPSLIIANEQTQGRGRRGNSFFSPKDTGLYMTLVFEEKGDSSLITPIAAIAVCEELKKLGISASIKWVNDVFLNGKKVCGILAERFIYNSTAYIAVGIGINITTCSFPEELNNAGSIHTDCNKEALALDISEKILDYTKNQSNKSIVESYRNLLFVIGKKVSYFKDNIKYSGTVTDINEHCNLILRHADGKEDILSSGEISIIL